MLRGSLAKAPLPMVKPDVKKGASTENLVKHRSEQEGTKNKLQDQRYESEDRGDENRPSSSSSITVLTTSSIDRPSSSGESFSTESRNESNSDSLRSTDEKPKVSYATMITEAIQESPQGMLILSEIYEWIMERYPYYQKAGGGWKNSIRHNLSLNRQFCKVPRAQTTKGGLKGNFWKLASPQEMELQDKERASLKKRSYSLPSEIERAVIAANFPRGSFTTQEIANIASTLPPGILSGLPSFNLKGELGERPIIQGPHLRHHHFFKSTVKNGAATKAGRLRAHSFDSGGGSNTHQAASNTIRTILPKPPTSENFLSNITSPISMTPPLQTLLDNMSSQLYPPMPPIFSERVGESEETVTVYYPNFQVESETDSNCRLNSQDVLLSQNSIGAGSFSLKTPKLSPVMFSKTHFKDEFDDLKSVNHFLSIPAPGPQRSQSKSPPSSYFAPISPLF